MRRSRVGVVVGGKKVCGEQSTPSVSSEEGDIVLNDGLDSLSELASRFSMIVQRSIEGNVLQA